MIVASAPHAEQANRTNWRALLLGLFLAFNAISLCILGILSIVLVIVTRNKADPSELLTFLLLAAGLLFSAVLLIPGIYLNGLSFFNLPGFHIHIPPMHDSIIFIILAALWAPVLLLGGIVASNPLTAILLPIFNLLAIGLPIICFLRITLRKLELPSAQQAWSVFGITLVIAPVIGIILEAIVLLIFMLIVVLYVASSNPALAQQIIHMAETMQQTGNSDELTTLITPLLFTPTGLFVLFATFSVAIPVIEESVKIMALWLFADKIKHPIQGFALGILCGAAFALAENLGYSSAGVDAWTTAVAQRASAALPHMLNSGILGWALVSAWKERAYFRLGAAYLAVMLIHGLWNALSIALALNELMPYTQQPTPPLLENMVPLLVGWVTLIIGTFGGLIYCNRALRRSQSAQAEYNEPLTSLN